MIHRFVVSAALAAAAGFASSAAMANGQEKVFKDLERHQIEPFDDEGRSWHAPRKRYRAAYRHHHHHGYHRYRGYKAWDGRYGPYPRRHFYVTGVHAHGYYGAPVHFATVTYRTYVYYTPTYPSLSYGYPPYAHVYNLSHGPIYNKPCLC
jgi:hypothetical protein